MVQKKHVIRETFDLNTSVMEVVEILSRDLKERSIRINTQFTEDLPGIWAGQIEIQQVVLNLLTNAIKALDKASTTDRLITIGTSRSSKGIQFYVADSGPGIPEDIRNSLFDSFVSDMKDDLGLGLGLTISRRIIETYDGQISAENEKKGGALFSFTLPAH